MIKVVSSLVGSIIVGVFLFIGSLYIAFKNDWKYIKRLRKLFKKYSSTKNDTQKSYKCCKLCECCRGLFGICCAFTHCCCCSHTDETDETCSPGVSCKIEELRRWDKFFKQVAIHIREDNVENMKKSYMNFKFHHKFYCFKKPCTHGKLDKCDRLLKQPILYLRELDFKKSKKYYRVKDKKLKKEQPSKLDYLKFIFESIKEEDASYKLDKAYNGIEKKLDKKGENLCLILNNFPKRFQEEFSEEEKYLLNAVLQSHASHEVQLIYR